jgi:2-keto-4-pentenoate hydratase/2-oxohepta-3-ene-1,7-dioic acid hydratase in catechol pathway
MVSELASTAHTLGEFLRAGGKEEARAGGAGARLPLADIRLLPPVTPPCQIICQGKNYLDHLVETGVKPKDKEFNLLFTKADSSLAPARGGVRRPEGVKLLDYELELGLVIGREIRGETKITDENLHEFVAGLVMANDVSARDIQVPERQWFRGKSFRGFCPVGPVLYLMDREDFPALYDLSLRLTVNGEKRQESSTKLLLHRPPETLSLISRVFDLRVGDLLLTGTPGGVAMRVKPKTRWQEILSAGKSDKEKFADFVREQTVSPRYLRAGDRVEASIRSPDGRLDLGVQAWTVLD